MKHYVTIALQKLFVGVFNRGLVFEAFGKNQFSVCSGRLINLCICSDMAYAISFFIIPAPVAYSLDKCRCSNFHMCSSDNDTVCGNRPSSLQLPLPMGKCQYKDFDYTHSSLCILQMIFCHNTFYGI